MKSAISSHPWGLNFCYDSSHHKLYCNWAHVDFYEQVDVLLPYIGHLHLSDGAGLDGEGLQIGEGTIDWVHFFRVLGDYHGTMIPEIWRGHQRQGEGFLIAIQRLSQSVLYASKSGLSHRISRHTSRLSMSTIMPALSQLWDALIWLAASPAGRQHGAAGARPMPSPTSSSGAGGVLQRLDAPHRPEPECRLLAADHLGVAAGRRAGASISSARAGMSHCVLGTDRDNYHATRRLARPASPNHTACTPGAEVHWFRYTEDSRPGRRPARP